MDNIRQRVPFYKALWFVILLPLCLLFLSVCLYLALTYPTVSPITAMTYFLYAWTHPHSQMEKETMAFLPYWRMDDTKYTHFDLLTEINYFSLAIDGNGDFITKSGNDTEPGWRWWQSSVVKAIIAKTQITGGKFTLTIASQKNKTLEALLRNPQSQEQLIRTILGQVTSRHLNGIVIDFEYDGRPADSDRDAFTAFSAHLHAALRDKAPQTTMSLTLLPLAVREHGLFDLPTLSGMYDRFIGMTYDYYAASSEIAGPVAPMKGFQEKKYFFDVTTTYKDYLTVLPKNKIVMGIPYYGWDWTVNDGKVIQSQTLPPDDPKNYTAVLSYARMRENKDLKPAQCSWDDYAEEPWCWYTDTKGTQHQIWFENNKSLGIKYAYAQTMDFSGIAIWTLGYDKSYPDLWNMMARTFAKK